MTKEEAIHFAECLKHNWTIDFNDMEDFCDMAIEALKAEETIEALKAEETIEIKPTKVKGDFRIDDIDANRRSIFEDIVWVVRCNDCRHRFYDKYNDCYMCDRHEYGESFEDDDYCSWGERREDE